MMAGIFQALRHLDRRILVAVVFLAIMIPLIRPMTIPVDINADTQGLYDFIQSLEPGKVVAFSNDGGPGWVPDLNFSLEAEIYHALRQGLKVVVFSLVAEAPPLSESVLESAARDLPDKVYGVDYVHLGFTAGAEAAMAKLAGDLHGTFPIDYRGTPVDQLPLMANVRGAQDIALVVTHNTGSALGVSGWLRQVGVPFGTPVGVAVTGGMYPTHVPYFHSGQVVGLLFGMRGAAEYETLVGRPGRALGYMGSQTFSAPAVTLFIILGNVWYLGLKKNNGRSGGGGY